MTTNRPFLLAAMFLLSLPLEMAYGLGQRRPDPSDSTHQSGSALTVDLAGTWRGTVQLDSTWGTQERALSTSIAATLRFEPVGDASPTTMSSRSVHAGTFEIDFTRFGFRLSTRDALGWSVGADSVRAVLNPAVDHGTVELRGVLRGEAITGTWRYVSDSGGAMGRFTLRRATAPRSDADLDATVALGDSSGRASNTPTCPNSRS